MVSASPLSFADAALLSLSYRRHPNTRQTESAVLQLARLTGLTRLELANQIAAGPSDTYAPLRGLQLVELVLLECQGLEPKLFTPGALTALQRLHIEDRFAEMGGMPDSWEAQMDHGTLQRTGDILLSHPQIRQLSGLGRLFSVGMRQGLREWHMSDLPPGTMVSSRDYHKFRCQDMKIYAKPGF